MLYRGVDGPDGATAASWVLVLDKGGIQSVALANIIRQIDQEINRLQQARTLLADDDTNRASRRAKRHRTEQPSQPGAKKTRKLTFEGRRAIEVAAKKRWAARRTRSAGD
jgi:hypothetical protein